MQHFDPPPFLRALTCLQPLLEEGDLLTQRVDSVQLLQGVGQPADGVRADVLGLRRREVVEGGQHQLEFLRGRRGAVSMPSPARSGVGGGCLVVFKGTPCCKSRCEALRQCGAQLGSLPDPCLREAGVALKIEQGWRESLAAHSPGLEPAVHGRGPRLGREGRGRGVQRTPTSSSASTLFFRSFISSFISLEGPEKNTTKKRSVSKNPKFIRGEVGCAGLRPSTAACCSPPREHQGSGMRSNACSERRHLDLALPRARLSWPLEYLEQSGGAFQALMLKGQNVRVVRRLVSTQLCPVPC